MSYISRETGIRTPESDIDGDTTLTLGLELVQNPGILERTLSKFVGFLQRALVRSSFSAEHGRHIPSRTFQWYERQYHRTCRSSDRW
jgi:hypothetical protein